jgi:alpha-tubulin suppressor-like RCC1 family protein
MSSKKVYSKSTLGVGFEFTCFYGNHSIIIGENEHEYIIGKKKTSDITILKELNQKLSCWKQLKSRMIDHLNSGSYNEIETFIEPSFYDTKSINQQYLACIL